MKKVLLIGFLWPYLGGSKRVIGLAGHLEEFGWQPYILTAPLQKKPPDHRRIIQTGYRGILGRAARLLGLDEKSPGGGTTVVVAVESAKLARMLPYK